ncbi:hypothetical protein BTVI_92601 [Pitangus sulphuratus]|nr:hypothetical protein BTVI_92601 [Pitangus sulphuratus]
MHEQSGLTCVAVDAEVIAEAEERKPIFPQCLSSLGMWSFRVAGWTAQAEVLAAEQKPSSVYIDHPYQFDPVLVWDRATKEEYLSKTGAMGLGSG